MNGAGTEAVSATVFDQITWSVQRMSIPGLISTTEDLVFVFRHPEQGALVAICTETANLGAGRKAIRWMKSDREIGARVCVGGVPLLLVDVKAAKAVARRLAGYLALGMVEEEARIALVDDWWEFTGEHWNVYAREMLDRLYVGHQRAVMA